jgi:signal transduction histidine kinase
MTRLNRLAGGIIQLVRPLAGRRTYAQAIDLAFDPFIGLAWSLVFGVLLLLGLVLAPTIVGLPVLGEVIMIARAVVGLERERARVLLGVTVDAPPPVSMPDGWWPRTRAMLGDRAGWRALGYAFILCFSGILGFAAAAIWAAGIAALLYPAWRWLWPVQAGSYGTLTGAGDLALISAAGLVLTVAGAWVVRAAARMDAGLVRGMLGPSPADLSRRIDGLRESRAAAVNLAAQERRRIERDLHDGVQARLVALAMDLGMARQKLESGQQPKAAAGMVAAAHEEAIRAVDDLRDLARGVHPAVLTDRGLDAALSALIARSPIPVAVDVLLPERPPAAAEAIAYFVIAEALTNIVKHSEAARATVAVRSAGNSVIVEVTDDGIGGAHPATGGGLAGLEERLRGVDGHLSVSSPQGGPTVIRAELPCAS